MYTPQAGNNIQTAVDSSHTLTSAFSEASGGVKNKKAKLPPEVQKVKDQLANFTIKSL